MEKINVSSTKTPACQPRDNLAAAALRSCEKPLVSCLKWIGARAFDPLTCNAYWIGANPGVWGSKQ